ncbi:hypothetical protein ABXV18_24595 [Vibrio owensii]|uniref:hypothetical protein n=1 Tax=Vibrio owensii TaxID=696485 RepID=UPI0033960152
MARVRKLLGKQSWSFDVKSEGDFKQLDKDHPLYSSLFSHKENRIIFPPRMFATCKSNGLRLTITCCTDFGAIVVTGPYQLQFESIEPDRAVQMIHNYMGSGDPHND